MDKQYIDKLQIGTHEINQPFWHQARTTVSSDRISFSISLKDIYDNGWHFVEYALIIINTEENLQSIGLFTQVDGIDVYNRCGYLYHNKIYPLEYETLSDDETNNLLRSMVRTNMPNILFIPLNIGISTYQDLKFCMTNAVNSSIDIYIKLAVEPWKNNILAKYISYKSIGTEMIEQCFGGCPGYGKKSLLEISRYGDVITNLYIDLRQDPDKKRIKNYYRLYNKIVIEFRGLEISTIPLDYLALYLKVVKNILLEDLSDNRGCHIIPINLNELINVSLILLSKHYQLKFYFCPNNISVFHHRIQKSIICDTAHLSDWVPRDLWNLIMGYLDCRNLLNMIQTCKFIYSIIPQKRIKELYDVQKITIEDLEIYDMNVKVMYYFIDYDHRQRYFHCRTDPRDNIKIKPFINELRSIKQYNKIINDTEYSFEVESKIIEWIIIEIDVFPDKNVLDIGKTKFIPILSECEDQIVLPYPSNEIHPITKDLDMYHKMHNPEKNRYMFYLDGNYETINLVFETHVSAPINIYVSYRIQMDLNI